MDSLPTWTEAKVQDTDDLGGPTRNSNHSVQNHGQLADWIRITVVIFHFIKAGSEAALTLIAHVALDPHGWPAVRIPLVSVPVAHLIR
jgi:hypothetical protein